MQNIYQDSDDENNKDKLNAQYISDAHMQAVANNILKLSYRTLGIRNINNRGYTYSGILTTSPANKWPIDQDKRYYKLFKAIKNGENSIEVPKRIKEILPDFPKVAITFSVTQNDEDSLGDQEFMKEAIHDYNEEYGTSFSLDEVSAYNKNINGRLAWKNDAFKPQSERLNLVIVIDRLLTDFDSQYLSTLFVDRPPMNPQNIIQSFSRTNRIFDQDKKYGNIITCQFPKTFSKEIDNALTLYSKEGIGEVLAPSWHESKQKFDVTYHGISDYVLSNSPELITDPSTPIEQKKYFVKQYQKFDKAFAAAQTYDEFDNVDPVQDYHLTSETLDAMQGTYETLIEQIKQEKDDDDEPTEYELESVIDK